MRLKTNLTTIVLSGLLIAAPCAYAQQQGGAPMQSAPAKEVNEATLSKFVEAMAEVQAIQEEFSQQLQGIEDNNRARQLQMKAQEEMISEVKESGLSVDEYNVLAQKMEQDARFRQQVLGRLSDS